MMSYYRDALMQFSFPQTKYKYVFLVLGDTDTEMRNQLGIN